MSPANNSSSPIRVLQAVYSMNYGGVENWLINILRNLDRDRIQFDFLLHSNVEGNFDAEIIALGSKVIRSPYVSRPLSLVHEYNKIFDRYGPYDAVHTHDVTWNGVLLYCAKKAGVPVRVVHSHNDAAKSIQLSSLRRVYVELSRRTSKWNATVGLACSELAARSYFGKGWTKDSRWRVFLCGEDFSPFQREYDRTEVRQSLGIPLEAFVVGHVGSFRNKNKNQSFIVDIASEVVRRDKTVMFLMVGDGLLFESIKKRVQQSGLSNRIMIVGGRSDISRLMLGAMDSFIFPSQSEGLGLAMVEAQAAGLPCICSDVIPREAVIVPELVRRISLTAGAVNWAKEVLSIRHQANSISRNNSLRLVENSSFDLANNLAALERIYSNLSE